MLFYVNMTVNMPHDVPPEQIEKLNVAEHASADALQRKGKWLHLWRIAGKWANVSIFNVDSPGELHDLLSAMPLYPFMTVEVAALCHHPSSIEPEL
jgi:muconolactone D-isomerase